MGDDPVRVAAAASGFIAGMKAAGVVGVLKHFPGHGDVTDTHVNSGLLPYDMARLESVEIVPFLDADAPAIMMGHITAPLFDPSGAPATLSPTMVGYLRDAGFDGVIMTDAMDMGAIVNHYSATDAGVRAVKAGIDMVLLGAHVDNAEQIAVYGAVLNAVRSGEIPEAQINASVERILRLKQEYGVLDWQELDPAGAAGRIAAADSAGAFTEVYNAAITVAQDTASLLPLQGSVGVLYPSVYPDIEAVCSKYATDAGVSIEAMRYNFTPLNWEYGQAAALSNRVEKVVIFTENADQIPQQAQLAGVLPPERTVVVALGSPYDLRTVPNVSTYVLGYDAVPYAMDSACAVLFGARAASGVLAVDLVR
jgi:beta-N-acetylhexosaminidase